MISASIGQIRVTHVTGLSCSSTGSPCIMKPVSAGRTNDRRLERSTAVGKLVSVLQDLTTTIIDAVQPTAT